MERIDERITSANTGLVKVAVQSSADTFVVNQSSVLRMNICGEKPAHRKSVKPLAVSVKTNTTNDN
jgi:hypothetical protein